MPGMPVKGTSGGNLKRNPWDLMNLLSSVASEWFLIFLLFVDAALSYLTVKFARYCKLQTPCPLCSRLDHVFGREKSEFYGGLLCGNHRREISSLISCHMHGKLADARGMCEKCLMSFVMQNKSISEPYSLLVGKLGVVCNNDVTPGSLTTKTCSCCSKVCSARSNTQRLLQLAPVGFRTMKSNGKPPLPRTLGRGHLSRRNSFKKTRNKISGSTTPFCLENTGVNPLPNVGYSKLKITSDSDSDFPLSDDEDGSYMNNGSTVPKKILVTQDGSGILPKVHTDNLAPVKQTHQVSDVGPSRLDQCVQLDVSKPCDVEYLASEDIMGHGLGEQNWKQAIPNPNLSTLPEVIDFPSPSNAVGVPGALSENKHNVPPPLYSSLSVLSEFVSMNDIPPSSIVTGNLFGASSEKLNVVGVSDIGHKSVTKHVEISELMTTTTADQTLKDTVPVSNDVDPSYGSELADSNIGREISGMFAELAVSNDAAEVHDQILPANGVAQSLNDTSPRAHGHLDELQRSDASSSTRIWVLQKSASVQRNDSGYESLNGCSISGIEVERIVDRLKQQVEYYRGCLSALQKEFDEERNASEVAARHAMAMITKLQEEKASLHMEALHYLRMMDEQAEYDMETLEKANDLLAEKDKEIQDLEADLEYYRINFPNEVIAENLPRETSNSKVEKLRIENDSVPHIQRNANTPYDSMSTNMSESTGKRNSSSTPLLDFRDEKLYISQCLKKLETKLQLAHGNWVPADMPSDGCSDKVTDGVNNPTVSLTSSGETQTDHQKEDNGLVMPTNLSALNGSFSTQECSDVSIKDNSSIVKGNKHLEFDRQESSIHGLENDLISLEKEISHLNGKLEALEANHDFLEHAVSSLRNGNEGLQFIREIAHQLQELRKIGIEKGCLTIP